MDIGIFAKTFRSEGVEPLFMTIDKHHLRHVHYNMICSGLSELPLTVPENKIEEVNRFSYEYKLNLVGLSATFNMIDLDESKRNDGLQSLKVLAPTALKLGTNFLSLCTGSRHENKWKWHPDNASKEVWTDLLETFEKIIEFTEKEKIILGVEPEAANVVCNAQLAKRLLNELQCDRIKIILDPANLFEKAESHQEVRDLIIEAIDILHDHIHVAHAKDRSLDGTIKPAGQGDVDFEFFIRELKKARFDGLLIMHALDEIDVASAANFLKSVTNGVL